ncbi:hypothetical protein BJ875DRAFT_450936 [Amylocarpus encephaloides]|uniref:Uncharacterized protein n=1 Tax=Amylocarpus encephaloides TaxID=45428 RepID=A0A9P7YRQ9_9HELO|nr:hypothetical protein BJ875DRAFT_450936 [Amylocarpus encephaloides]
MSTPKLSRILIKTHHMTSRKKISVITRAAKTLDCVIVLKVGAPPGIMLCEGANGNAKEWETVVRKLRYKDMQLMRRDEGIDRKHLVPLGIKDGYVREIPEIKEFAKFLEGDAGLYKWWRVWMGYTKGDEG